MMTAGEKSESITIVRDTITRSTTDGSEIRTEATIAARWANVKPITGREFFAGQQTQSRVSHRIMIDLLATAEAQDRVLWGFPATTFHVVAVLHDYPGWTTTLMCEVRHGS